MRELNSKTKYIYKNVGIFSGISLDAEVHGIKKEDIYEVINGQLVKKNTITTSTKNVFSIYTKNFYELYSELAIALEEACLFYDINKEKQRYMTYGKKIKYSPLENNKWYDFPGINIPFLHGFYFADVNNVKVSFKNTKDVVVQEIKSGDLIINKPTDLIKIETDSEIDVIEIYISPLFALKNNEPGVWVPII